jgi:hypothetical protein
MPPDPLPAAGTVQPALPATVAAPNRFFDIDGDVSLQLAPWALKRDNLPPHEAWFVLREPLRFRSDIAGGVIVVPQDFRSDLASIPQFAWSIFMRADDPRIELGAWVHDLLYRENGVIKLEDGTPKKISRKQADQILCNEAMADLWASSAQRWTVYQALRRFGKPWKGDSWTERFT